MFSWKRRFVQDWQKFHLFPGPCLYKDHRSVMVLFPVNLYKTSYHSYQSILKTLWIRIVHRLKFILYAFSFSSSHCASLIREAHIKFINNS